ncbi:MAG: CsbD family protein [Gammaproteobacteria bacterium]
MNWEQVKGNWGQVKGKARQMWGDFTDDELDVIEGKREELVGRLQTKYGYTKETAEEKADDWVRKL